MSNILIAHTNRADSATLSNGSWVSTSTISLNNLKDGNIDKIARSTNAASTSTRFAVDLGANYPVWAVGLINHNVSASGATLRVKGGTAAPDASNVFASGQVFDSTALACKQMASHWDVPSNWGSQYPLLYVASAPQTVRYVTVDIVDTANAAGYVQAGRLFIGTGFQPTWNPEDNSLQDGWDDLAESVQSKSGKKFFQEWGKRRWMQFQLPVLSATEGDQLHELDGLVGTSKEVLYVPDPADAAKSQRYGFLGLMRELTALEYPYCDTRAKALKLEEKR